MENTIAMMNPAKIIFPALLLALFFFECQNSPEPTKEQLISDLKSVHELLSDGEYKATTEYFKGPEGMSEDRLAKELKGLLKKNELSVKGIEVLNEKGKFGKLSEVFPERGGRWMERNGITTPEDCYGLGYKNAEVGAYWNGSRFLLIRLDDVGKL